MIQANISEVKNRLSYYLRLVRGGEQVEILDRKRPLARIVHIASIQGGGENSSPWIEEARDLGLVTSPMKGPVNPALFKKDLIPAIKGSKETGVLQALLDERDGGR